MKKPKLNFGAGGIQGMLAQHVEKIVLGVVGLLVGLFLYTGYNTQGYSKNPAELHTQAISAQNHIIKDTSIQKITSEQRDRQEPYRERVQQSMRPTAASEYAILPFNPTIFPPTQPRQDPELFAPLLVEAEGFLAAVHEMVEDGEDPYIDDKNAAPVKKVQKSAPPKKNRGDDDVAGLPGMMMGPPGGAAGGGKGGRGKGGGAAAPGMMMPPGVGGAEMLPPGDGLGDGGATGGAMGGAMTMTASVSESYIQKYVRGFRPGSGGNMMAPGGGGGSVNRGIGVSRYMVAVRAVVPHQKLVDEFRRVFAEAQGYDPERDNPRYVYYNVERAEVGADPKAELTWTSIRVRDAWKASMEAWTSPQAEIADSRYLDPVLSQPIPPAMMVDPARLGLHAEIPRASAALVEEAEPVKGRGKGDKGGAEGEDAPDGAPFAAAGGAPGVPGIPGMVAPGAGGMRAPGAGGMMPPGAGGMMPPGVGGAGAGGMVAPGAGGMMAPGAGGMMPPGMGGYGMGGMGSYGAVAEAVKYKLIRFYDFDVQPGKIYRYRVRVWVEDPNHPQLEEAAPSAKILSAKVAERIKTLDEKDKASNRRTYYRLTEWSEPSGPVSVPSPEKFVGGKVRHGRLLEIREHKVVVPLDEPSATVLPIVWDVKRAVDVPGYADAPDDPKSLTDKEKPSAYRGTVLNFKKDARVLRPDSLEMKLIEKHVFQTNAVVVDLRPAEPLRDGDKRPGERKEPLLSAGEVLLVDSAGNLIVRNELDDTEDYRKYMFVGEEQPAGGSSGGLPGGGMAPPGMAPPGMAPPGDLGAEGFGDLLGPAAGKTKGRGK